MLKECRGEEFIFLVHENFCERTEDKEGNMHITLSTKSTSGNRSSVNCISRHLSSRSSLFSQSSCASGLPGGPVGSANLSVRRAQVRSLGPRSPGGEGTCNPLCSCPENPCWQTGAWRATSMGSVELDRTGESKHTVSSSQNP